MEEMQYDESHFDEITDSPQMIELKCNLAQCTGTEHYYYYPNVMTKAHFTDGIFCLREEAKCDWLVSDILIASRMKFKNIPFQIWIIKVKDGEGLLTMNEDTDEPILYTQYYSFTDFPEGEFKLYLIDGVLLLPSEY